MYEAVHTTETNYLKYFAIVTEQYNSQLRTPSNTVVVDRNTLLLSSVLSETNEKKELKLQLQNCQNYKKCSYYLVLLLCVCKWWGGEGKE